MDDQVRKYGRNKEQRQQDTQEEDGSFACHNQGRHAKISIFRGSE